MGADPKVPVLYIAYVSIRQRTVRSGYMGADPKVPVLYIIRQHKAAYVSIPSGAATWALILRCLSYIQHTSAFVSIRQHTFAYVF